MTLGPRIGQNRMKGQCIAVNARSCGSLAQFRASVNTHGECEGTMDGTNLVEAIKAGDVARVTECLAQSSAANAHDDRGQHPLHVAVIRNERIIARLLIEAGADLNERDNEGSTARSGSCASDSGRKPQPKGFARSHACEDCVTNSARSHPPVTEE